MLWKINCPNESRYQINFLRFNILLSKNFHKDSWHTSGTPTKLEDKNIKSAFDSLSQ